MFGIRTLVYIIAIVLVVLIVRRLGATRSTGRKPLKRVGDMVQCAHCGTYVPKDEAVRDGDRYYCCEPHRNRDR